MQQACAGLVLIDGCRLRVVSGGLWLQVRLTNACPGQRRFQPVSSDAVVIAPDCGFVVPAVTRFLDEGEG
jgi:hypothetical protein